ncbi:cytochrome c biogenesis protein ResB [Streptomyces alfalfae]|uniref:Cytochrome C biogenesis protein n=1 Tax=Streptomyces alfalfae TaxID=1642299 RepID=A0ABM6GT64_9ACTN|nr:cytochrome c biogenesis protein ResB [Streptomyces alfalfae]AYA17393.1 cytochrome c biogenesis protein ResB [Streptomyces fradiae]APY87002.1 cytochrome C biogenesis protein [Streptomyces alfalfae]QUI33225.1 cytochrome c biogenesis protein ResB [Streptomyces alfalfae]RXX37099.1 cytochrome c biogenesis protein ResB [Streptomyces alfalfae]RZM87353.1 cytochrome c biogenesis protein ResB [Streptomyces alfalfae]
MSKTEAPEEQSEQSGLDAAGAQLSTAPKEDAPNLPSLGVIGWFRWFWRQLTSMRVALILLLLLSLGAIPGSLIPQNNVDELKVQDFMDRHSTLGPLYDKLQLFDVYSSVWFSAIYILLFVSLIGCIVPRTWQFVGQLRGRPPGAPKKLTRLPAYTTWRTEAEPEQVHEAALAVLKQRRFRAHTAAGSVAAEKGYLREAGNLMFHIALIVMLIAFAAGQLFKSEGGKLITEGDGFANTLSQYDDFKSGSLFDTEELAPFSFKLDDFEGTYEKSGPNRGTPRTYRANVTYSEGVDGPEKKKSIEVNKPLEIDGSKVYLIGHGYAPTVTVRDSKGEVVYRNSVPLLPIDQNGTATGAIKVLDGYKNKSGKKEQLGFNAFFVPTFAGEGKGQMFSQFPAPDFPVLALSAYHGSLGVDSGVPQNVYQLDTRKMTKFKDSRGELFKKRLLPGETMKLPGGQGSITFEKDIKEWATFQISQEPGSLWALVGAVAAIAGLAGSLFIQRRRVWVRAVRGADGVTVVEMAGLGRSESAKLPEELADLAARLHDEAPSAPEPNHAPEAETVSGSDPDAVPAEGAEK